MTSFFKRLHTQNEWFLTELEFVAELVTCREPELLERALAAVQPHMISDRVIMNVVEQIRKTGNDPVDLLKRLKGKLSHNEIKDYFTEMMEIGISGRGHFLLSRTRHVVDQYRVRSCDEIASKLRNDAHNSPSVGAVIQECEDALAKLKADNFEGAEQKSVRIVMDDVLSALGSGEEIHPEFGIPELDGKIGGLLPGTNTLVAALTSVGKSAFIHAGMLNMARSGYRVLLFSYEMSAADVLRRFLVMASQTAGEDLKDYNNLSEDKRRMIREKANAISELGDRMEICFCPGWSAERVCDYAHQANMQEPVDVIMVDYLQLMDVEKKVESNEKKVDHAAKLIIDLGRKIRAATVMAAQLNDEAEGVEPELRHLRDSKAPGHHADNVVLLSRKKKGGTTMKMWGKKNRNGPLYTVETPFCPSLYTFGERF